MIYATVADLVARYGADALAPAGDRDGDGALDTATLDAVLRDASSEIDLYILRAGRTPPLANPAAWLILTACELALWRLPETVAQSVERTEERYKQAIDRLKLLDEVPNIPLEEGAGGSLPTNAAGTGGAVFTGDVRLFSRDSLAGL